MLINNTSLNFILDWYKLNKKEFYDNIVKGKKFSVFRIGKIHDIIMIFLYISENSSDLEKFINCYYSNDLDLLSFLNSSCDCRKRYLDGILSKEIKTNDKLQEFLYLKCFVNKEEVIEKKQFDIAMRPSMVLMSSYFLGLDSKEEVLDYLYKFKNEICNISSRYDYYQFLEKQYINLFYDYLIGTKLNLDLGIKYLKEDEYGINNYYLKNDGV